MLSKKIDELIEANEEVVNVVKGIAEQYRNLLVFVVLYYSHPDRFSKEQAAEIEKQVQRISPAFLTLPWEKEPFDISRILQEANE